MKMSSLLDISLWLKLHIQFNVVWFFVVFLFKFLFQIGLCILRLQAKCISKFPKGKHLEDWMERKLIEAVLFLLCQTGKLCWVFLLLGAALGCTREATAQAPLNSHASCILGRTLPDSLGWLYCCCHPVISPFSFFLQQTSPVMHLQGTISFIYLFIYFPQLLGRLISDLCFIKTEYTLSCCYCHFFFLLG